MINARRYIDIDDAEIYGKSISQNEIYFLRTTLTKIISQKDIAG
jgi:hypothetical protein